MKPVARERLPLVANTLLGYRCRRTRQQNGFPCFNIKTRWTRQGKRLARNAAALDRKPAFLNDLSVRRRRTCQQRGGKYARHAPGYGAEVINKTRTHTGFFLSFQSTEQQSRA